MIRRTLATLILTLTAIASLSAQAATLMYSGEVTTATEAFAALTPIGTPVGGDIEVDGAALSAGFIGVDDILSININVGGFCFATAGGDCGGTGAIVPVESIDAAAITGTSGVLGGSFSITTFSPTFLITIPITFDLDGGLFMAEGGPLGIVRGDGTLTSPVPLPASVWLLVSALFGLVGVRRRA